MGTIDDLRLASAIDEKWNAAPGMRSRLAWDYISDMYAALLFESSKETALHLGGPIDDDGVRRLFAYWLLVEQAVGDCFVETTEALELVMESFDMLDWWRNPGEHVPAPLKADSKLLGMFDAEPDQNPCWKSIRDTYAVLPSCGTDLPRLLERWGGNANDAFAAWLRVTALRQPATAWEELRKAYELVEGRTSR